MQSVEDKEEKPVLVQIPKVTELNLTCKIARRTATLKAMNEAAAGGFTGVQFNTLSMDLITELRALEYKVEQTTDKEGKPSWTITWDY